jgi:flagellar basal-body rod modification protein FlgD
MSAISGSTSNPPSTTGAFSEFSSGEFLDIIFTELTNQDPLAPNETKDLIEQISTIRDIESDTQLTNRFDDLVQQNQLTVGSSMIGKFVTGLDQADNQTASFVDSVSVSRNGIVLNLSNNARVPLENVSEVIDPNLISFTPDGGGGGGAGGSDSSDETDAENGNGG